MLYFIAIVRLNITVRSEAKGDRNKRGSGGTASIIINEKTLNNPRRGYNVVVLNGETGKGEFIHYKYCVRYFSQGLTK